MLCIWCVPHQADLVVKAAMQEMDGGAFSKIAHAFSVHLRMQYSLITEMGSTCPKDTTRWSQFSNMISWMVKKCLHLLKHIQTKDLSQAPPSSWWIMAAAVHPMLTAVNVT